MNYIFLRKQIILNEEAYVYGITNRELLSDTISSLFKTNKDLKEINLIIMFESFYPQLIFLDDFKIITLKKFQVAREKNIYVIMDKKIAFLPFVTITDIGFSVKTEIK